jgi:phage-related holin
METENIKNICIVWYIFFCSMMLYLWIDIELLSIYFALMAIDSITWVYLAFLTKKVTSNARTYWIIKKVVTILLVLSISLFIKTMTNISQYISDDMSIWLTKSSISLLLWVLVVWEFYSILENIIWIRQKKEIEKFDTISIVIAKIQKLSMKFLDKIIQKADDQIDDNNKKEKSR